MWEFKLSSIEDLEWLCGQLGVQLGAIEDVSILAKPVQLGGLVIPNSLAVHPMEGCDGDAQGRPGKLTLRRYERFATGGAGLIWVEATAVVPEARANPRQLWLHNGSKDSFASMVKMIRAVAAESMGRQSRPMLVAQLTHSGRYSRPQGLAQPIIAQRDPYRDAMTPQQKPNPKVKSKIPDDCPIVTDEYLDELQDSFVKAARLAFEVGFDAVDVKSCHGYLINELFACRHRLGKYGGSFENRTSFFLEVIDKIRGELGDDKLITTRMGVYDAIPFPYGWGVDKDDYTKPDLTESKRLISLLQKRGIKLINITAANPYYNPHIGRPFNEPIVGGYEEPEHPLIGVARLVTLAGEIQKEFPNVAVVGTGYSWLRTLLPNVAAANKEKGLVTLIGVGRMGFAYPDFARDIITKGKLDPQKVCVACSGCTQIMRDGGMTGCVVRDNDVYGPQFRKGRLRDRDNLLRLAQACRKCQEPTCQLACPAGVDIPKFISLFLDGDERGAYEVLRQANIFPEVCAWLCPAELQCEGNCLQGFIGDGPLPIADIQKYLAEQANKNSWSRLKIPKKTSGKKVAIIGAGPAGLACAAGLLEAGHTVTIFDKSEEFGGMIEAVIPPARFSNSLKNEIAAVFANVPEDRFNKRLGTQLNAKFNLDTIMAEGFDAAFIALGQSDSVRIANKDIDGLWNAMEFLSAAKEPELTAENAKSAEKKLKFRKNSALSALSAGSAVKELGRLDVEGKVVAVIGGGNTAMDVAATARRLGAKDVYVIYRRSFAQMPAWKSERDRVLNEGVHFLILTQMLDVKSSDGRLTAISVCPTKLGKPDQSGRRRPVLIESSAYELQVDIVVEAIGQKSPDELKEILPGVLLKKGVIATKEDSLATSREGIFAGGDLVRGPSTVVAAVADGMAAAKQINDYLTK